jgi:hypothetical protein
MAAQKKDIAELSRLTMHDPATQRLAVSAIYAAGAILAAIAARSSAGRERASWALIGAILLLLMAAKELHLIDSLSRAGRTAIKAHGWYGVHRQLQDGLVIAFTAIVAVGAAFVARWLRKTSAAVKLAGAALLVLVGSLVLRAISIHAVDAWSITPFAGLRKGWWIELIATLVICAAATWRAVHAETENSA